MCCNIKMDKGKYVVVYPFPMHISQGYSYMLSIAQFVNGLARHCSVDLLCLDSSDELLGFYNKSLSESPVIGLNMVQVRNNYFGIRSNRLFFQYSVRKHISQLLAEGKQVVVYSRDYKQLNGLMSGRWTKRRPQFMFECHQIQSQNLCRNGCFQDAKKLFKLEQKVFDRVDAIVPITQTLSSEIDRVFPLSTRNRIVLPVGVADKFFFSKKSHKKDFDLIYSGNFSSWKGVDILIRSVAEVRKQYPKLRALLIGAHEHQQDYYLKMITELKLEKNIEFRERASHAEIPNLLQHSRVGVVPISYQEDGLLYTSPLKLYEYLAAGIVVVAARVPSLMSALPEEMIHWAIPDNVDSYTKAILNALKDREDNSKIRIDFARNLRWEQRGKKIVDYLECGAASR